MTTDPEDKPNPGAGAQGEDSEEEQDDRPTVAPPFDPIAFAQEVLGGKPSPIAGTPAVTPAGEGDPLAPSKHGPHSSKTPERGLRARATTPGRTGRPTPTGLLSLANARIPSNLPPRKPSSNHVGAVDREWEELATSPPPPLQQELIDAMARGEKASSSGPVAPTLQEMNDRVSLGDYTGALEIAEKLQAIDPDDAAARSCAETCRGVLRQMYTTRVGPLDCAQIVMVARDQMRWLTIDHRAGFVLSLVDGVSSLEMILDVSGMPELDALRILSELAQQRIIAFR
ncbi:hypothetical protein BH11MYX4_BH11MYX4_52040 [soil metagenome]